MTYILREKYLKTFRESFKIYVNIENNRRASGMLGKRDDPKLFNPRSNKREGHKPIINKKNEEDKMDQVLGLLKNLNPQMLNTNKENNNNDRSQYANNFSKQNKLQNFTYNTNWKDGKPINEAIKNTTYKGKFIEEVPWCMACQSPHSSCY